MAHPCAARAALTAALFEDEELADVRVLLQTDCADNFIEDRAHRSVLAAVSPVWKAMFVTDMQEKRTSSVTIDMTSEAWGVLKQMVYTGEPPDGLSDDVLEEVTLAADKYDAAAAVALCMSCCEKAIRAESFWRFKKLAERLPELPLKSIIYDHMSFRGPGLLQDEAFYKDMTPSDFQWAVGIVRRVGGRGSWRSDAPENEARSLWRAFQRAVAPEGRSAAEAWLEVVEDLPLVDLPMEVLQLEVEPLLRTTTTETLLRTRAAEKRLLLLLDVYRTKALSAERNSNYWRRRVPGGFFKGKGKGKGLPGWWVG